MAKAKKEVAVVEDAKTDLVPAFMQDDLGTTGAEGIETSDITVPRIKLGQALSAEVKDGACEEGDLFLNVTGEVLAAAGEALRFTPIAASKEFFLWRDRNDNGGGIMARATRGILDGGDVVYFWDKPNQEFTHKLGGRLEVTWKTGAYLVSDQGLDAWGSEVPGDSNSGKAATAHHNYVVSLPDYDDMIVAFSLSKTQAKRARDLNALIRLSKLPMFGRVFSATTDTETKGDDTWANIKFKPAGTVASAESYSMFKDMNKGYAERGFTVDQSDEKSSDEGGENF